MNRNIGSLDRAVRIVFGLTLIVLAATGTVGWWGWFGIVPLLTAIVRFCPLYTIFGIRTCEKP